MVQIKKPSLVDTKITVGKKVGTRYYQVGVQKDPPLVLKGLRVESWAKFGFFMIFENFLW